MSQQTIRDNINRFLFRFKNLTSIGLPSTTIGDILDNEKLYNISPKRSNFYRQVVETITNPNTDVLEKILKKENLSRYQRETIDEKLNNIMNYFNVRSIGKVQNEIPKMNQKLGTNILTQEYKISPDVKRGGGPLIDQLKKKLFPYRDEKERAGAELSSLFDAEQSGDVKQKMIEKDAANQIAEGLQREYQVNYGEKLKELTKELEEKQELLAAVQLAKPTEEGKPVTFTDLDSTLQEKLIKKNYGPKPLDLQTSYGISHRPNRASRVALAEDANKNKQIVQITADIAAEIAADITNQTKDLERIKKEAEVSQEQASSAVLEAGKKEYEYKELLEKKKDDVVIKYKNDPYYSPNNEKINWTDRTIFIALTYIIRALALFLMEWAIFSGFIKNFNNAFALYFGMYICIFLLIVFLTNGREDDMIFRMLFFYINTQADNGKGILRIVVHMLCILMLLPVPYVVKEYREFQDMEVLSFQDKTNILNGVEKFSLYTWLLTSIVALNV